MLEPKTNTSLFRISLVLYATHFVEVAAAAAAATAVIFGRKPITMCTMNSVASWYPIFYDSFPECDDNFGTQPSCATEVAWPLITWVLAFDGLSVLGILLLRLPVVVKICAWHGLGSVYRSLFLLPLHVLVHFALGGLIFYAFPYLCQIVGAGLLVHLMAKASFVSNNAFGVFRAYRLPFCLPSRVVDFLPTPPLCRLLIFTR